MAHKLPVTLQQTLPLSLRDEWPGLESAHEQPAVNSIRINPKKPTHQFDTEAVVPWCKTGRYLQHRPSFTFDPLFHGGTYYVQEASSMFLEFALLQHVAFVQRLRVLDLCASPGGKSTHIASLISDDSLLISNEVIGTRVNMLSENLSKWGYDNTWVSHNDPARYANLSHYFDIMLVDAPCSGSGLFRKIPDYQADWNEELVTLCAQRQQRIVHDAYAALARNGLLVYMTCSLSQAENEDILDHLLDAFALESCRVTDTAIMDVLETVSDRRAAWGYRFFPHRLQGEGFFLAILRKMDGAERSSPKVNSPKPVHHTNLHRYLDTQKKFLFQQSENLFCIREEHKADLFFLQEKIKLTRKGILLGRNLSGELIPDHELALYTACTFEDRIADLDLEQAIAYLRKEPLTLSLPQKGWHLVRYAGTAIGWLKNLGNRINNYYPANQRILSQNILHL